TGRVAARWDCTQTGPLVGGVSQPLKGDDQNRVGHDGDGHGTHVAGIIAGAGAGDKVQFRGMAPEATLHVYKVLDDGGSGNDSWIIKALDHIASVNDASPKLVIHGVNLSLG